MSEGFNGFIEGRPHIVRLGALLKWLIISCLFRISCSEAVSRHAVIYSASRGWLNYRHTANALAVYHSLREHGIPRRHLMLLLSDPLTCNPRNARPTELLYGRGALSAPVSSLALHGDALTEQTLLNVLTGWQPPGTPTRLQLRSNQDAFVTVFLTGHGGDQFLKIHDQTDFTTADLFATIRRMHALQRYRHLLLVVDTCQASTLCRGLDAPNVTCIASSIKGQSSYAHTSDRQLGLHVIDEFSLALATLLRHDNATGGENGQLMRDVAVGELTLRQAALWLGRHVHLSTVVIESTDDIDRLVLSDFVGS